jgi:hypothetical protein
MSDIRDDQRKRLRRHPVAVQRDCSLGVITFEGLEWTDHTAKIMDLSATGIGIESDQPIEPGIIWFKDCVYGQKCGVLVWCKQNGPRYRAGIQFVDLNHEEEEYLRRQVERSRPRQPLEDPHRVVASLIDYIRKDREGTY